MLATAIVTTYYATLMAITLRYFVESFYPTLPWSYCRPEWGPSCLDSAPQAAAQVSQSNLTMMRTTSAEFYFK